MKTERINELITEFKTIPGFIDIALGDSKAFFEFRNFHVKHYLETKWILRGYLKGQGLPQSTGRNFRTASPEQFTSEQYATLCSLIGVVEHHRASYKAVESIRYAINY